MGWVIRIAVGAGAIILALAAVLVVRTFNYGGAPAGVKPIDLPETPRINVDAAARHLSEAIGFRTITITEADPRPGQDAPWTDFHAWLEATYPAAHAAMGRETVAGYTLLYTWPGSDLGLDPVLFMAHQDVVPVNIGTESDW
ncbi:MAG: hypothetical protein AAFQ67_09990, partial [Pseudomonadota bacterium]